MTAPDQIEPVPAIPEDIFQTACGIVMEAKSLKSMLKHKDVVDAIAVALVAERALANGRAEKLADQIDELMAVFGTEALPMIAEWIGLWRHFRFPNALRGEQ